MGRIFGRKDAKTYDSRPCVKYYKEIAEALASDIKEGAVVLDLGCGTGKSLEGILSSSKARLVIGLEPSASMLEQAMANLAGYGSRIVENVDVSEQGVVLVKARAEDMPLQDASVDNVIAVSVLEYLDDIAAVLRGVSRVLKPRGTFNHNYDFGNRGFDIKGFSYKMLEYFFRLVEKATGGYYACPRFLDTIVPSMGEYKALAEENGLIVVREHSKVFKVGREYLWRYLAPIIQISKLACNVRNAITLARRAFDYTIAKLKVPDEIYIGPERLISLQKV